MDLDMDIELKWRLYGDHESVRLGKGHQRTLSHTLTHTAMSCRMRAVVWLRLENKIKHLTYKLFYWSEMGSRSPKSHKQIVAVIVAVNNSFGTCVRHTVLWSSSSSRRQTDNRANMNDYY